MNFIDNWKISSKILAVVAVLSCVTVIVVALGANALLGIDGIYADLTKSHYPSTIALVRSNRALNAIGYAVYRTIAYDGASAEAKAAAKAAEDNYAAAVQFIADATRLDPADKAKFDVLKPKLEAIHAITQLSVALALKNEDEEARKDLVKGDNLIGALNDEIVKMFGERVATADTVSAAASANARSAMIMMVVIGTAGLAVGVGIGLWLSMAKIAGPLVRLGQRMSTLAQGKFDTEIEGTERRDEIGQMARTVLVFRDAGLEKVRLEKVSVEQRQQTEAQRLEAEDERKRNVEAQAAAAEEQASAVKALAAGLGRMSEGDLRFTWLKGSPNPISRSRTISTPRSASSRTLSSRSSRLLGTSAMPRLRSPPAPPTCRSGPRSRPPAWKRPPPRCRRFPRP